MGHHVMDLWQLSTALSEGRYQTGPFHMTFESWSRGPTRHDFIIATLEPYYPYTLTARVLGRPHRKSRGGLLLTELVLVAWPPGPGPVRAPFALHLHLLHLPQCLSASHTHPCELL